MIEIKGEKDFERQMVSHFDNTKVLIFASEGVNVSLEFLEAMSEVKEDLDDDVTIFVIKEDLPENQQLFFTYKINSVPASVILNADLTPLYTLGNISPADLVIKIEEAAKVLQTNRDLEASRLEKLFKRKFVDNKFVLFKFVEKLSSDEVAQAENYLKTSKFPYFDLKKEEIREEHAFCGLAHLSNYLFSAYDKFADRTPIAAFNKQIFYSFKELKEFCESNHEMLEQIQNNEEKRIEALETGAPILLYTNSCPSLPAAEKDLQEKVMNALKEKKVLFSYVDVSQQNYLQNRLIAKTQCTNLHFPVLKMPDGSYINSDKLQLALNEDLTQLFDSKYIIKSVDDRIKYLLDSDKVIVFIKGTPEFPQCGFSKRCVEILTSKGVKFSYYNILADNELRERLKAYSNWKTYPQIYVDSELVGGNDILMELDEMGQFEEVFGTTK